MLDLAIVDAIKNFWIQAGAWADNEDFGISIEKVQNPASSNLVSS